MAAELGFITRHTNNLKVILIGASQGAAFSNAVMQRVNNLEPVHSIELGTPFFYKSRRVITEKTLAMAEQHRDFVIGFITTKAISKDPSFINITPGVRVSTASDSLKQNYQDPGQAIMRGADIIIVGRGIYASADPVHSARNYRQKAWEAYKKREFLN